VKGTTVPSRSNFLAGSIVAAIAPVVASAEPGIDRSPATPAPAAFPPLRFETAAFEAALATTAAHRHLFTAVKLENAVVLTAIRSTLDAYAEIGVPLRDVQPVAALYHGISIALAFDDAAWNEFFIPAGKNAIAAKKRDRRRFRHRLRSKGGRQPRAPAS
jgi:hypothetical protein